MGFCTICWITFVYRGFMSCLFGLMGNICLFIRVIYVNVCIGIVVGAVVIFIISDVEWAWAW